MKAKIEQTEYTVKLFSLNSLTVFKFFDPMWNGQKDKEYIKVYPVACGTDYSKHYYMDSWGDIYSNDSDLNVVVLGTLKLS